MTTLSKSVRRSTIGSLDGTYGKDRDKRLIVSLEQGDLISLRPAKTQRPETVSLFDVYRYAMRCRLNKIQADKNAVKKAKRNEANERARLLRSIRRGKL